MSHYRYLLNVCPNFTDLMQIKIQSEDCSIIYINIQNVLKLKLVYFMFVSFLIEF